MAANPLTLQELGIQILIDDSHTLPAGWQGLGDIADILIEGPPARELIELGYLVPTRVFAPSVPDLNGVRKDNGDFNEPGLLRVMNNAKITGDIIKTWIELGQGRPTILFAVNREHSDNLSQQFRAAGIRAKSVDADTNTGERNRTCKELAEGTLQVVCSVNIISYGWDLPAVSCAILARPTLSLSMYLQQCGRILRPSPGKVDALILDHTGNTKYHGFVEQPREWTLEGLAKHERAGEAPIKVCPECCAVCYASASVCPECGYEFERIQDNWTPGKLSEIPRIQWSKSQYWHCAYSIYPKSVADRDPEIIELVNQAYAREYRPGFVYYECKRLKQDRQSAARDPLKKRQSKLNSRPAPRDYNRLSRGF